MDPGMVFAPAVGMACRCVHEGTWYQAKVTKVNAGAAQPFHIHYHGWNKRHDRWVDAVALRPLVSVGPTATEVYETENDMVDLQQDVEATMAPTASVSREAAADITVVAPPPGGSGLVTSVTTELDFSGVVDTMTCQARDEGRLRIPPLPRELKNIMVADWNQIVNEPRHWVPLPRTPTITRIFEAFLATKREQRRDQLGKWEELIEALRTYFDTALPKILLYRQEREQYECHKPLEDANSPLPSALYGAEHLLRLLTRLPTLLAHTDLNPEEVPQIQAKLGDFLRFLVRHQDDLFLGQYVLRETVLGGRKGIRGRGRRNR